VSAFVAVSTVDSILAVQVAFAWAGESRETTKSLGWWHTDFIDSTGGGDFLARLLPRTHPWAPLEAVHLGMAKDSIFRWIENRGLPAHKIGRLWKFRLSEVDDWMRRHDDSVDDHAPAVPFDDRSVRMPKRRGRR